MVLMKKYVTLTTAAIKMGKRHFYSDFSNGIKDASLDNSIINHPGNATLTSWNF